jgi:hypothetical protein
MRRTGDMRRLETAFHSGLLYLVFIGMLGLLYLERRSALTPGEHTLALLGIVLVFCGLIWVSLGKEAQR